MPGRFEVRETTIPGLQYLVRMNIRDERGSFERMFCSRELKTLTGGDFIEQINRTITKQRGAVRGLHFQRPPYSEIKFVTCLRGEIYDVAVDIRKKSPTFLCWHSEILSPQNHKTFVVPEGFAHGFQTLTDDCELLYFHTKAYHPESEGGLNAEDPRLKISWPLNISFQSVRDKNHPKIDQNFMGI